MWIYINGHYSVMLEFLTSQKVTGLTVSFTLKSWEAFGKINLWSPGIFIFVYPPFIFGFQVIYPQVVNLNKQLKKFVLGRANELVTLPQFLLLNQSHLHSTFSQVFARAALFLYSNEKWMS